MTALLFLKIKDAYGVDPDEVGMRLASRKDVRKE
jgi:hypothetical protein